MVTRIAGMKKISFVVPHGKVNGVMSAIQREFGDEYKVHRNPNIGDEKIYALRAMSKTGVTGYDFVSLLIRQPIRLITGKWRKQKNEEDRMYCSEYAMWTHRVERSYRMSPHDVYQFCIDERWTAIV